MSRIIKNDSWNESVILLYSGSARSLSYVYLRCKLSDICDGLLHQYSDLNQKIQHSERPSNRKKKNIYRNVEHLAHTCSLSPSLALALSLSRRASSGTNRSRECSQTSILNNSLAERFLENVMTFEKIGVNYFERIKDRSYGTQGSFHESRCCLRTAGRGVKFCLACFIMCTCRYDLQVAL